MGVKLIALRFYTYYTNGESLRESTQRNGLLQPIPL